MDAVSGPVDNERNEKRDRLVPKHSLSLFFTNHPPFFLLLLYFTKRKLLCKNKKYPLAPIECSVVCPFNLSHSSRNGTRVKASNGSLDPFIVRLSHRPIQ